MEHVTSTPAPPASSAAPSSTSSGTPLADAGIALGALDGRYRAVVAPLVEHLSEAALNRERVRVEVEWLVHLTSSKAVPGRPCAHRRRAGAAARRRRDFGADDVAELAEIERETVHDVKAVEYYLKRRMAGTSLADLTELVHFCCTSEDVNNLSYALMVRGAVQQVWLPGRDRADRRGRRAGDRSCATSRCWPARTASPRRRPRSARSWPCWRTGCVASCAASSGPSTWARSTARPARTARTWPPCRTPTGSRSPAASSSTSG